MKFLPTFLVVLVFATSVLTAPIPKTKAPIRLTESYMLGEWKFVDDSDWKGTIVFKEIGKDTSCICVKVSTHTTPDGQKIETVEEGWWQVYDDDTLQIHCKGYYLITFDLIKYPLRGKVRNGRKGNWLEIVIERK